MSNTIDARGPRFSALLTTIVLALVLITNSVWLLALQAVVFAIGALRGPQFTPYALIFKNFIQPQLKGEGLPEDVRPPRFAQSVGLAFTILGLLGAAIGVDAIFALAVSFALAAAFLNAAFNFCLGCVIYLRFVRLTKSA